MNPVYISVGIGLITLLISLAAIFYRSGAIEANVFSRIDHLERKVNALPNIQAEYIRRPECERRTSDFCRKIDGVRAEIQGVQANIMQALSNMDDKREKARDESDEIARQLAAMRALFDQYMRRAEG